MNKNIFLLLFASLILLTSCKSKDKVSELNYMQNVEQIATEASTNNIVSTIQKGDQLVIFVSAKNMEVVRPFNQSYYSVETTSPNTTQNSERLYLVDSEGFINFPILGSINTTGKKVEDLKNELAERITTYVKNPTVTVRLANFKVTILGEVNRPGQYTIPEAQTTLLNVIGIAGDLTSYAKRNDILMVRNVNGVISKERINLMDSNFVNSPYFSLKQGDVIYVSSNQIREKLAKQDPNTNVYIAVAGMVIGLAGIFITIFKN